MIYAFFLRIWKNDSLIWQQASLQIHAQCITFYFGQSSNSLENFEDQIWALWTRREKNSEHYKAWREQVRGKTWTWNFWKCTSVHKRYCFQQVHWNGDVRFKNRSVAVISVRFGGKNMSPPSPQWHEDVFKRFFQNHFLIFSLPQLSRHHRLFCKFGRLEVFISETERTIGNLGSKK